MESLQLVHSSFPRLGVGSAGRLHAFEGNDAVLPCGPDANGLSRVTTVEWLRVDGPSPVTLHVLRFSEELVKDKAPEYEGRTRILKDGSLKLAEVRQQDTGTYKWVTLTLAVKPRRSPEVRCFPSALICVSGVSC